MELRKIPGLRLHMKLNNSTCERKLNFFLSRCSKNYKISDAVESECCRWPRLCRSTVVLSLGDRWHRIGHCLSLSLQTHCDVISACQELLIATDAINVWKKSILFY